MQDSLKFWIPRHWSGIPGTWLRILCKWNLDSAFQLLAEFRIFWGPFLISRSKILDSTAKICYIPASISKISCIPESGFPYMVLISEQPTELRSLSSCRGLISALSAVLLVVFLDGYNLYLFKVHNWYCSWFARSQWRYMKAWSLVFIMTSMGYVRTPAYITD